MSEYQKNSGDLNVGEIRFYSSCKPPLGTGNYKIRVEQQVTAPGKEEILIGNFISGDFNFSVAGPRFSLDPSEIYSVYPPKGEIGDFASSLPHIVFTRRTLPWERHISDHNSTLPWMALLVFSSDDFIDGEIGVFPEIKVRTVAELLGIDKSAKQPDKTNEQKSIGNNEPEKHDDIVKPAITELAAYESLDELCNTIDIPGKLFQEVAPSLDDLLYLAHVRQIKTDHKETVSFLADGWFSVVLSNRFPNVLKLFSKDDFINAEEFVGVLKAHSLLAKYQWNKFDSEIHANTSTVDIKSGLAQKFNEILTGRESIYDKTYFKAILSPSTEELLKDNERRAKELIRLNRLLLEDAFPKWIVKRTNLENRVYLVSLEGLTSYLRGGGINIEKKNIRLAVLASWSFHCEEAYSFKSSIKKLRSDSFSVPYDEDDEKKSKTVFGYEDAAAHIKNAWNLAYTALAHNTRFGEKTVSWYRGPFVPFYKSKESNYDFLPAADAAVRYDPKYGMMDVSYAAAFQLGRLLAMQDRYFSTALYAYRCEVRRQINDVLGRKQTRSVLDYGEGNENVLMNRFLRGLQADQEKMPSTEWREKNTYGIAKRADPGRNELQLTTDFDLTIPQNICQWLARRLLLYRVPFTYLVPDERMLKADSIRFFYLDPYWLKCLLEGACSVGRSNSHDELVDKHLRDNFLKLAFDESQNIRTRQAEQSNGNSMNLPVSNNALPENEDWLTLTGFLMRSPVVKGWQGLEMRAWNQSGEDAEQKKPMTPLRIDRLAPDIMLCIFNGKVQRIEIKQPPEGMHFGATVDGEKYKKGCLRRLDGKPENAGRQIPGSDEVKVPLRNGTRVVDVAALADKLKTELEKKELNMRDKNQKFTSAEFAVQMVESPGRAIFDVNPKPLPNPDSTEKKG